MKTILVVCEGSRTEPNYFESLRKFKKLRNVRIRIVPGGGSRVALRNMIDRAIGEKQSLDWDKKRDIAWIVFDIETPDTHPDLGEMTQLAIRNEIQSAVSNPAFEYWYLLHFEESDRPFENAEAVLQSLVRHIIDYEKSANVFSQLQERTIIALNNAERLRARSENQWEDRPNPSTNVDVLVRLIWEEN